jgi:primosomal protein N' (replication factor Y)
MSRTTLFADVIVPLAVPNKYTYRVPTTLNDEVAIGKRALVQFGKTRIYTGIIYRIHENPPKDYTAKYIEALLDEKAVVTEKQLKFWDWISFYYCATPGEVMNAALPSGLKLSSTSHIQMHPDFNPEEISSEQFSEKEHQVLDLLQARPNLSFEQLGDSLEQKSVHALINKMMQKKAIVIYEDIAEKYKPKLQSFYKLEETLRHDKNLGDVLNQLEKRAFKQAEALLYFLHLEKASGQKGIWVKKADLLKKVEDSALRALVKKNILNEEHFETGRLLYEKGRSQEKKLSPSQERSFNEINEAFKKNLPVLLHGVTGSGKTEVYIRLIRETIATGKQVLFLIPEIALTTQLIQRLRAVFGETVGVYHSRFSENERVEIWNNVLADHDAFVKKDAPVEKRSYNIIMGARSSLFLPFRDLGLIIVDEEHDSSFKQHDPAPRYHARDAALYLASLHRAHVVLGSATPSLESYYHAQHGRFVMVQLPEQFVSGGGTETEVCDLNYFETTQQMRASITPPLFEAVNNALREKQQIILFQNRRGFAPYTECRQCGHIPHCVQCDVSLIYHKQQEKLICHYCGYSISPPATCSACGSNNLHYRGMGTEKIEEDAEILFPGAKIARMDLDSTRSKYAYKQLIDDFESGNIDILIGTQMVTKGLDFEKVKIVGVLGADTLLNFPDFRSFERAFQMITQVRGRAGRSSEKGRVFIQTTQPAHNVIAHVRKNDLKGFYFDVLQERKQYFYPPFSRLIELRLGSKDANELNHLATQLFAKLKPFFGENLLGPEFPLVSKVKNLFYKKILLKVSRETPPATVRERIYHALNGLQHEHKTWKYRVHIDVDPV